MSTTDDLKRSPDELARLGADILRHQVEPRLRPQDADKFVAIAVDESDFEIDDDDYAAVSRLLARHPKADVWLTRAGQGATYRIGRRR